jgi:hypothetical protein
MYEGSGVATTEPAVLTTAGLVGWLHAASKQIASWTAPTARLELLTSSVPPASVSPAGGIAPTPVKKKAIAANPPWLAALEVRKSTSVESGFTPVQVATSCPQANKKVSADRPPPAVVVMSMLL